MASRVGVTFGLDPVVVLEAPSHERLIRQAAHNIAVRDAKRASGENGPVTEAEDLP